MKNIPRDTGWDSTLSLFSDGYRFVSNRCRRYGTDAFRTRLMFRPAICAMGEDAARMFYHPDRFTRKRAVPPTTMMLLQDDGSVQFKGMRAHARRKQLFVSLADQARVRHLVGFARSQWRARIPAWQQDGHAVLLDEAESTLCRAVCEWSGIPLEEEEARERTRELSAMIDGAGAVGPRNWKGLFLRSRTERWARAVIEKVRKRELDVHSENVVSEIAHYRERNGTLLDLKAAAVELLNIIRPTVAVARYIVFAALAMHHYPRCAEKLRSGDESYLEWFVQEVRRFYPFCPSIGGSVREEFDWAGHHFRRGTWVLLDVYGTNHDPRLWKDPETFNPERFREWNGGAFNFIPQGGGDLLKGRRCPGERITIELVKDAVRFLTTEIRYEVPVQDLRIDLARMPAMPASRMVMQQVSRTGYS